jgi:hypothetical protein
MIIISVCPGEHKIIVIFTIGIKESGENGNKTSNHTITKKWSLNIQTNIGSELQCHQSQCCNVVIDLYTFINIVASILGYTYTTKVKGKKLYSVTDFNHLMLQKPSKKECLEPAYVTNVFA